MSPNGSARVQRRDAPTPTSTPHQRRTAASARSPAKTAPGSPPSAARPSAASGSTAPRAPHRAMDQVLTTRTYAAPRHWPLPVNRSVVPALVRVEPRSIDDMTVRNRRYQATSDAACGVRPAIAALAHVPTDALEQGLDGHAR